MYLANILFRTAQLWPDEPSLAFDGGCFTWKETLSRVRRISAVVHEVSASGARIGVLALSSHHYVELSFAIPMAGRTMVPMNTRLSPRELVTLLRQAEVSVLVYDDAHLDLVEDMRAQLDCRLLHLGSGTAPLPDSTALEQLIAEAPLGDQIDVDPDAPWAIIFTGGTTGLPKGVVLSHRAIALNLQSIVHDLDWGDRPRFLQVSPMFHMAGLGTSYAVTVWGGCQIFLPRFSADSLLATIAKERCTSVNLVPTMMAMILARDDLDRHDLSSLRHVSYGASAIGEPTLRALLERLPNLRLTQFYGQTEAGGHLATLQPDDHVLASPLARRLRSAGRVAIGARVMIQDEAGAEVERGTWGEICARIDSRFSGYLAHTDLFDEATRGGWLHTGDVGYLDDAGYLFVTDRIKDMIVSGGENVSSREVEDVILRHPAVAQAAVVAVPDAIWGERVHAHVVLHQPGSLPELELIAFCRAEIAGFKAPKSVTIRTEPLPLSAIGKVRKDLLRNSVDAIT